MDDSRTQSRSSALRLATQSLGVDLETANITRLFLAADIPSLLLRGRAIASRLYTDGKLRSYGDIDLLVPPDRFARAEQILERAGYEYPLKNAHPWERDDHAHTWKQNQGPSVDLHFLIWGIGVEPDVLWRALLSHVTTMVLADVRVSVLSPAGQALVVTLHAAQHLNVYPAASIAAHVREDLRRAATSFSVDIWREALDLARQLRAEPIFATGLGFLPQELAVAQEIGARSMPSRQLVFRELWGCGPHLYRWAQTSGIRAKSRLTTQMLVPSKAYIMFRWPFAQRGKLALISAYVWHIARTLIRAPRALITWLVAHRMAP